MKVERSLEEQISSGQLKQTSDNFTFPMGVWSDATLWPASVVVKFMPPQHCVAVCHDGGQ